MTPQDFIRKWKPVALTERATAYGWPEDISTEDALARLLALNLERSSATQRGGV
jgi:hypothetical protein